YLVVGEGDDRKRLQARAREAGLSHRVRFLGAVGLPRLIEIYRAVDLFVMPSTGEGFGIAFLEAMASGTPSIGLDVAGARDSLADGELGTGVAKAGLTAAIARGLEDHKRDPVSLAGAVSARFGRQNFTANACVVVERVLELS